MPYVRLVIINIEKDETANVFMDCLCESIGIMSDNKYLREIYKTGYTVLEKR